MNEPANTSTDPASDAAPSVARFEQSLDELERLVERLEGGELSLDESLRSFERGVALFRECQSALQQAELRVKLLLDPNDPEGAQPFEDE
ncbi:MAG TPA: exodeoxyribonuclease VII small subunit [Rhodanobacteraceae bacterium]|nr:exodeoxyribonuclease VII small subunit [Rhodanobacteraceae bacterium]